MKASPPIKKTKNKIWLLPPLCFLLILGITLRLTPNSSGWGTHQALGLPPCLFHYLTHLPCPSCGLTTSWTYLSHLEIKKSIITHPMGLPLFFIFLIISLRAIPEALGKKTVLTQILEGKHHRYIYIGVFIFLISWFIHLVRMISLV
jgi:hypothetical protein